MTEAEFTEEVLILAAKHGVLAHWCRDSRRCEGHKGFPDLVLVGKNKILFVELKSEYGYVRPEQTTWRYSIVATMGHWQLWRPSDLESGAIEKVLFSL